MDGRLTMRGPLWRRRRIACPITPCVRRVDEKGVNFSAAMQQEKKILSSSCRASTTTNKEWVSESIAHHCSVCTMHVPCMQWKTETRMEEGMEWRLGVRYQARRERTRVRMDLHLHLHSTAIQSKCWRGGAAQGRGGGCAGGAAV